MGMKIKLIVLSLFYSLFSQAQTYEGKIGDFEILLDLSLQEGRTEASALYFYKSKSIYLDGFYENSELILSVHFGEELEKKELFKLKKDKTKLTGIWQSNGKNLKVELKETSIDIDDYRESKFEFVRDSVSTLGTKELVWFTELFSEERLFRLGNGFTKSQREFLNPILDAMHIMYAYTNLDCIYVERTIDLKLVSDHYVSFIDHLSLYCGGPHPNYETVGYNFDIKNKIALEEITDLFPNLEFYSILKNKYQNDSNLVEECKYFNDEAPWQNHYTWFMNKEGLSIMPFYPHGMTYCGIEFPITYRELVQTSK